MKIFLTGATGYIGSAVGEKLQAAGHDVLGLARSHQVVTKLEARGIEPLQGDLKDVNSLIEGAKAADAVINTGVAGGSGKGFDPNVAFPSDHRAVETFITALAGTNKPFIQTSGGLVVGDPTPGEYSATVYSEEMEFTPPPWMTPRVETEKATLAGAAQGVRTIVIRPPHIYGRNGSFAIPILIESARKYGTSAYIGKGENIWSMVHIDDLADLYVLALEQAPAGSLFNCSSSEVTMKQVTESISRLFGWDGRTESWTVEEAQKRWNAGITATLASSERSTGEKAKKLLGWNPQAPSLADEIEHGSYSRETIAY